MYKEDKDMENMDMDKKIADNFEVMFQSQEVKRELFRVPSEELVKELESVFGLHVPSVINFYKKYQPYDFPMLKSYVKLLGIEDIIEENQSNEPGMYLAELGVYVIAVTVGGHVICIDTNDMKDGEPSILLIDATFCSYNEYYKAVEIGIIPDKIIDDIDLDELFELNYENLKKCIPVLSNSFHEFMTKLSLDEYGDIEEYLEE